MSSAMRSAREAVTLTRSCLTTLQVAVATTDRKKGTALPPDESQQRLTNYGHPEGPEARCQQGASEQHDRSICSTSVQFM